MPQPTALRRFLFYVLLFTTAICRAQQPVPVFNLPADNTSEAGHIKLVWDIAGTQPEAFIYELQHASDSSFLHPESAYEGPDKATFISGLPDGQYYYRVRAKVDGEVSDWSAPIAVQVQHHSLALALSLAGVGVVVFLMTVGVVVVGVRKSKIDEKA
jgi:hypothetical protein